MNERPTIRVDRRHLLGQESNARRADAKIQTAVALLNEHDVYDRHVQAEMLDTVGALLREAHHCTAKAHEVLQQMNETGEVTP